MATLNFNGLTFSYEPLGVSHFMNGHQKSPEKHYSQRMSQPVIIPSCTAQLAEEAAVQMLMTVNDEALS